MVARAACPWVSQPQATLVGANQRRRKAQPWGVRLPCLGPRTFLSLREGYHASLFRTPTLFQFAPIRVHPKPSIGALSPKP